MMSAARSYPPPAAPLDAGVTVTDLAEIVSRRGVAISPRSLRDRLLKVHALDTARGEARWLYRFGLSGPWRVNLSRLQAAHPEMFSTPLVEDVMAEVRRIARAVGVETELGEDGEE